MKELRDFWNTEKGLMLIGSDGSIRFTAAGRTRYAPLLAKYGFALETVKTQERFCEVMEQVNTCELEENTRKLEEMFNDPKTNDVERELIRKVLGRDPAGPGTPRLRVVY